MRGGAVMAGQQHHSIRREARFLRDALAPAGIPLILLKGAAYVVAGLPAAEGRLFADVDILVPRERLADAESALMLTGFAIGAQLVFLGGLTALERCDRRASRG